MSIFVFAAISGLFGGYSIQTADQFSDACNSSVEDEVVGYQSIPTSSLEFVIRITSFQDSQNLTLKFEDFACDQRTQLFISTKFRSDMQVIKSENGDNMLLADDTTRFSSMGVKPEIYKGFYASYNNLDLDDPRTRVGCDHCMIISVQSNEGEAPVYITEYDDQFNGVVELMLEVLSTVDGVYKDDQFSTASMGSRLENALLQN